MSDAIPVFPLPDHVVLPHIVMPYRLFEERYRKLAAFIQQQMEKDGPTHILIPCLQDGWQEIYDEAPPFHDCA